MQTLQPNATLQGGKYIIKKVLGQGGFGITYLAEHELLGTNVAIKEFFFKQYCDRDETTSHVIIGTVSNRDEVKRYEEKFLKEARVIARLNHPNIIKIHDVFKENNTAYYVMDYIEGENLADLVKRRGAIPEAEAVGYISQAGEALAYIHNQHLNHLDVKPSNLMLRKNDSKVILIDFGMSKQYDITGGQTSSTPIGISHGYAPIEQYKDGGVREFSPQTDIYALGATLYKLVTGNTPPQAGDIINEGLPELPNHLSVQLKNTIAKAMEIRRIMRHQKVSDFMADLPMNSDENTDHYESKEKSKGSRSSDEEDTIILEYERKKEKLDKEKAQIVKETQELLLKKDQECKTAIEEKQKAVERAINAEKRVGLLENSINGLTNDKNELQDKYNVIEKKADDTTNRLKSAKGFKNFLLVFVLFLLPFLILSISQCSENQRKLASCPPIISEVLLSNTYENGEIETVPGGRLLSKNSMYITPQLKFTCFESKTIKLQVKMYLPDGSLSKGTNSPEGCSYETETFFPEAENWTVSIGGWGNKEKGNWPAGKYKVEIWNDEKCLYVKNFEIYK